MNIQNECISCIFNQALRAAKSAGADPAATRQILDDVAGQIPGFSFQKTPPETAVPVYASVAKWSGNPDPLGEAKAASTEEAGGYIPFVNRQIDQAEDPLHAALKAAVAGNVIDLGAQHRFDIGKEVETVFEMPFAIDDFQAFARRFEEAKRVLVVGDNVGEHLFDKVMLERFKGLKPDVELFYAVRGVPIINDVTLKEADEAGIDTVATVIDSGVDTPGLVLERANEAFKTLFDRVDLIIAKGMGNFECLESREDPRLFMLFKVKCDVVSQVLGVPAGALVFKQGVPI